jgi:putative ATPase
MTDLFAKPVLQPLAERRRPRTLAEMVGQRRLLAEGSALRQAIESGHIHSMILWGPPGCGKTTLALLVAQYAKARFVTISAVMSGLPEVRKILAEAEQHFLRGEATVLFVDEVHRFNKIQQDAFLPFIESGRIVFIGATTENPSFELNSALLSRCRVHVLEAVSQTDIVTALQSALSDSQSGIQSRMTISESQLAQIAQAADGDVRRALTLLEIAADVAAGSPGEMDEALLQQVLADRTRRFDKGGDQFYDQISALHKSVRNSNPDGALYWLARMLDGGCDPGYLARRLTRMAVEDVGLADPRALTIALQAWDAYDRLGAPEGELALVECVLYLAVAAKSNAAYMAYKAARADIKATGSLDVPLHFRNASTGLMRDLGYGRDYVYDPSLADGIDYAQSSFPEALGEKIYYQPGGSGAEIKIREKLEQIRALRDKARVKSP